MPDAVTRPLALVTGASAGIGTAYAERLASDGWDLIVVGRRRERLEDLSRRLEDDQGARTEVVATDLGTDAGMAEVDALCRERPLRMLVNNAGLAHYMPLTDLSEELLRELVAVDVLAPTLHSRSAALAMVQRGEGAIITVSSLLAFGDARELPSFPKRAVYASAKAYVTMFSRLLAAELEGTGVRVQVVCPGVVRTEFHSRQDMDMSHAPRLEASEVVQASLTALERNEVVCIPTLDDAELIAARDRAQGEMLLAAFPPRLAERYAKGERAR